MVVGHGIHLSLGFGSVYFEKPGRQVAAGHCVSVWCLSHREVPVGTGLFLKYEQPCFVQSHVGVMPKF